MSLCAIIPVANLVAANAALELQGFGPGNFSVAAYAGPKATHAALHAWNDPIFSAAVKALAGVVFEESEGDPITRTKALIEAQGAQWGAQAPALPNTGNVTAGSLYSYESNRWWVIQTHNRTTYGGDPAQYPALIRMVRDPNVVGPWTQPIDQYDSYSLLNPFTGKADECTHAGKSWYTTIDVNVWEPGTVNSGWVEVGQEPPPPNEWPDFVQPTGAHDAYQIGDKVTFEAKHYTSKINANVWSPSAYPAGWQLQP